MKIEIIDDGVGAFATLNKLKYNLSADYVVKILDKHFPLGQLNKFQLISLAKKMLNDAVAQQFDAVVFSSIALSMASVKMLAPTAEIPLFGCEAPILHASTYTASQVLVVGDKFVTQVAKRFPNVIAQELPLFSQLVQECADEKTITAHIAENIEQHCGNFDCIALGISCANAYRHCFSRVVPNAQIFDSLEGIARKMRKKYKKYNRDESTFCVFGENGEEMTANCNFFIDEF